MPKSTPLNALHRASGARMVDFGGWDMPVHYGSQIEEHHAVRRDAGVFDVSHMQVVDLEGAGVREFLRRALANDVEKLRAPGKALYSCMLNEAGGVVDDLIAYHFREDWFRLVVNAGTAETDIAWLESLRESMGATFTLTPRRDQAILAVQGPRARERFTDAFPHTAGATRELAPFNAALVGEMMVARTGYTGEDGFEVVLPATRAVESWQALVNAGVRPAGLGARDTLRLEAGMNLYGQDMDDATSPLDAGLAWTVDLKSQRDFIGRSALESRGQRHRFLGLVLEGTGGVLRAHQSVRAAGGEGEITSGSFSPTLAKSIALARLPLDAAPGDRVEVMVRDKPLAARVVKPPFVRHGKILTT
ncbi:MAG TPA: glycine cleavage system aminomethyltransferase GcvT [Usitatibacter sp.]|nr:glycine cleavage system aminomethyltransferase GcvT [Usitatibacter sp.]